MGGGAWLGPRPWLVRVEGRRVRRDVGVEGRRVDLFAVGRERVRLVRQRRVVGVLRVYGRASLGVGVTDRCDPLRVRRGRGVAAGIARVLGLVSATLVALADGRGGADKQPQRVGMRRRHTVWKYFVGAAKVIGKGAGIGVGPAEPSEDALMVEQAAQVPRGVRVVVPHAVEFLLHASPGVHSVVVDAFADIDRHLVATCVSLVDGILCEEGVILW